MHQYLTGALATMSINQICGILVENALTVEKTSLRGGGKLFFRHFFNTYSLRDKDKVIDLMQKFTGHRIKGYISNFVFTQSDVKKTKKTAFEIFQNIQPKKIHEQVK